MDRAIKTKSRKDAGFVLIASMLMLIILTFMAIELYHNFTVQQNMSSNAKEKGRAFQMAQSTLQYAEYQLLNSGLNIVPVSCSAPPSSSSVLTVCTTTSTSTWGITNPTSSGTPMTLNNSMTFNPSTIDTSLGISFSSTGSGQNNYFQLPQYYVQYLGKGLSSTCPSSPSQLYLNTALAYGGTGGTVAVVQSTYQLQTTICNTGAP